MANPGKTYRLRRDADGNAPETVTRPCLRCRRTFDSEHTIACAVRARAST